jgi:hypothetical protein
LADELPLRDSIAPIRIESAQDMAGKKIIDAAISVPVKIQRVFSFLFLIVMPLLRVSPSTNNYYF